MVNAYCGCVNLTTAIVGESVTNAQGAYANCTNLSGNAYIYANSVNTLRLFADRSNSKSLSIYVHKNSSTFNSVLRTNAASIVGYNISWNYDNTNERYYNSVYNIYVYPVANVAETRSKIEFTNTL
jgi:hypothetical protein